VRVVVAAPRERLADVAMGGLEEELRAKGYRLGVRTSVGDADVVVASRDSNDWYLSLGLEASHVERGPKWLVRLSVFREPGRQLRGELTSFAIVGDGVLDANARRALVRGLGKKAADDFAENFSAATGGP
jgi:hypothetical protein